MSVPVSDDVSYGAFRHEAFLYSDARERVEALSAFVVEGLRAGDAVLAVLDAGTIEALRTSLGTDARRVCFGDMADIGRNPARIIQAWEDFLAANDAGDAARRGIGEPIWAERTPAELLECEHHESLLNVAFEGVEAFWLLCPYDTAALPADVVERALVTHPYVCDGQGHRPSTRFSPDLPAVLDDPLPQPPPEHVVGHGFDLGNLHSLRGFVAERARVSGLSPRRTADIVLAASEVATNSVLYGGGRGLARVWDADDRLVFEFSDRGHIDQPLVGRFRPGADQQGGFGVWLANQLCDLVQIRSTDGGTIVRLHISRT